MPTKPKLAGVMAFAALYLSGCDPYYAGVRNKYHESVKVTIYTTTSDKPTEVSLPPGVEFPFQDSKTVITGITVTAPDGTQKTYSSDSLAKAAPNLDVTTERIVWSITPRGIVAACVASDFCCSKCIPEDSY
jgi:hypothetical protein